jgi:hypothetical protein
MIVSVERHDEMLEMSLTLGGFSNGNGNNCQVSTLSVVASFELVFAAVASKTEMLVTWLAMLAPLRGTASVS